jgi:two-component system, LuxR family, response regulator FixJ
VDFSKLTQRELDVLHTLMTGKTNKQIGLSLKISPRTVEVHRLRIMKKLGAGNIADLARMYFTEGRIRDFLWVGPRPSASD